MSIRVLSFALLLLLATAFALAAPALPHGSRVLTPFDYHGVTLDGGHLRAQADEVREYYLRISNDDLLRGFRQRAGLPAPGVDLGGWYTDDVFHTFGQILSGLSRLYAATGDPACREKVDALIDGWSACIAPDGYFYASAKPNAPSYIYDKMVGGLVDAYLYCGSKSALAHLSRITAWAIKHLKRGRPYADGSDDTEWYTLTENLYRAYLATGDPTYRDFGRVWEYTEYWRLYATATDIFARRPTGGQTGAYHAYSHVNTLGGLGAAYLLTGDRGYLNSLVNAYDYLQRAQIFATGGYGQDEQLLPRPELLDRMLQTHASFETQCGSWAAFKMSKYLISCTGDARFGDWIERLIYNGIGADIPMGPDGTVFYYSDYNLAGATKTHTGGQWSCCTGTRPEAVADYDDLIYFRGPDSLHVNLFVPSTVSWQVDGVPVIVHQRTRFPEAPRTEFLIDPAHPVTFDLCLRVPGWLASPMRARLNGRPFGVYPVRDGWAIFRAQWRSGDRLEVGLPMGLWTSSMDPGKPHPACVLYGPVVLAFRAPNLHFAATHLAAEVARNLVPVAGEPLTFRVTGAPDVLARPFYAFKENEPYYMYFDPRAASRIDVRDLTYTGDWNVQTAGFRATSVVGSTAEVSFDGVGIRWHGLLFDDAGKAEVSIDGKVVAIVDQYAPGRGWPFAWEKLGLTPGHHTFRLRCLEEYNPASKGRFINLSWLEPLPTP